MQMNTCRFSSSGVHIVWRVASVANAPSNSPGCFRVYVQNHHLGHFRKMSGAKDGSDVIDRHKKQKTVTSLWVPISTQHNPREGNFIRELTTDCGNSCKMMNCEVKSDIGFQAKSVHNQSSSTSDARDLSKDPENLKGSYSPSNEARENMGSFNCVASGSAAVETINQEAAVETINQEHLKQEGIDSLGSELNAGLVDKTERHSVSIEVGASLIRFVKGKGGATQRQIEEEMGVKIFLPSTRDGTSIVIEGSSIENVNEATDKINGVLEEAIRSPLLDYSHFVSLPLAIYPELVEKLNNFQNSILGDSNSSQGGSMQIDPNVDASDDGNDKDNQFEDMDVTVKLEIENDMEHVKVEIDSKTTKKNSTRLNYVLSDLGIDRSIFIKPKTFHLTVLMLKLWSKERVAAAAEILQRISPKVLEALENRPISIRLKGLECMKGSPAKARVLYAPVEEIGGEGRLMRACRVIIEAYVEAGLVLERDAQQTLKLHATLMNARHRKRKNRSRRRFDSFDARGIFKRYGSEEWGEYVIQEAHLSQRFAFGESGYYHCCASIPFPVDMKID